MVLSVLALAVGGWPPRAWAQGEFFQTNSANNSVTVYAGTASGDTAPLRTLQGASTGLSFPGGIALDLTHNELVVTNESNNSVTVYARTATATPPPSAPSKGPARD